MQKSQRTIVIGSALAVAFGAVSALLFPLYATPLAALALPFLVILTLRAGPFCGGLAVGMLMLVALSQAGWMGALFIFLAFPGALAVVALLLKRKAAVHYATYYGVAAMLTGMVAFWALYTLINGADLATDLVAAAEKAVIEALGEASLDAETAGRWQRAFEALFAQTRDAMRSDILPQMVLIAGLSALLAATLPIIHMRRKGLSEDVSRLSLLHTWRVPRRLSLALMGSYLVTIVMAMFGVAGALVVSTSVWSIVTIVYGTAALSFVALQMRRHAMARGTRNLLLTLCVLLMAGLSLLGFLGTMPFVILGIVGEMIRLRSARIPGDLNGPFGPPDAPVIREDKDGDDPE